jgi:hypothetical protein
MPREPPAPLSPRAAARQWRPRMGFHFPIRAPAPAGTPPTSRPLPERPIARPAGTTMAGVRSQAVPHPTAAPAPLSAMPPLRRVARAPRRARGQRAPPAAAAGGGGPGAPRVDRGFSLLEWTSALVPQGALVTGAACRRRGDRGAPRVQRAAGGAPTAPQHHAPASPLTTTAPPPPGAKQGWRLAWQAMVRELAPQDAGGGYSRPAYSFDGAIGSAQFPVRRCLFHTPGPPRGRPARGGAAAAARAGISRSSLSATAGARQARPALTPCPAPPCALHTAAPLPPSPRPRRGGTTCTSATPAPGKAGPGAREGVCGTVRGAGC